MAIRIRCVGCGHILATKAPKEDTILTCPSCKGRYNIRKGGDHAAVFNIEKQPLPFKCIYCQRSYGTPHGVRAHYFKSHRSLIEKDKTELYRINQEITELFEENRRWQAAHGQVK